MAANWSSRNYQRTEELQYTKYMFHPATSRLGNLPAHL